MNLVQAADEGAFNRLFPNAPFPIRHVLANDDRLTLSAILNLMRALPRDMIEYSSGKAAINQDPEALPSLDLSSEEVIQQIETAGAWMVLKRIEHHPAYKALVEEVLTSVARACGRNDLRDAGFSDLRGFLFVSSPGSVTPFHLDNEDNIFLQIHGDKQFCIYDNRDGAIVSEERIERAMSEHRNLAYDASFDSKGALYELSAGDGLFVPYQWPHWVKAGNAYSISVAITWKTEAALRRNDLLFANGLLRKRGFPQPKPGASPLLDAAKISLLRVGRHLTAPLRKHESLRRWLRGAAMGRAGNYFYRASEKS